MKMSLALVIMLLLSSLAFAYHEITGLALLDDVINFFSQFFGAQAAQEFSFTTAGDHAFRDRTDMSINVVKNSGSDFYLALGDLSYHGGNEQPWCENFKSKFNNVIIISGNHDDGGGDGDIDVYVAHCPFTLGSFVGDYGKQYYFDYPQNNPIARFIMLGPGLEKKVVYNYNVGGDGYLFTQNAIDDARGKGIKWIIVGMHKNCISVGRKKECQTGTDIMNLLIDKKVDLILQAHDHNYQRSHALKCIRVGSFDAGCIADDGSDGTYPKGAGPVILTAGTFGAGLYKVSAADSEVGYFTKFQSDTWGVAKITVSDTKLSSEFLRSYGGSFSDSFSIIDAGTTTTSTTTTLPGQTTTTSTTIPGQTTTTQPGGLVTITHFKVTPTKVKVGETLTFLANVKTPTIDTYYFTVIELSTHLIYCTKPFSGSKDTAIPVTCSYTSHSRDVGDHNALVIIHGPGGDTMGSAGPVTFIVESAQGTTTTTSTTTTLPGETTSSTTTTTLNLEGFIVNITNQNLLLNRTNEIKVFIGDELCRLDKNKVFIRHTTITSIKVDPRRMSCTGDRCVMECTYEIKPDELWISPVELAVIANVSGQIIKAEKSLNITSTIMTTTISTTTTLPEQITTTTTILQIDLTEMIPDLERLQQDLNLVKNDVSDLAEKLMEIGDTRYRRYQGISGDIADAEDKIDHIIALINQDPNSEANRQRVLNELLLLRNDLQDIIDSL